MKTLQIIGLMSGSSLDGVDLACVTFHFNDQGVISSWALDAADTITYDAVMIDRLRQAPDLSGFDLWILDADLGHLYGHMISNFIVDHKLNCNFISSHGHTVFHYPGNRMTCQIGDGDAISAHTGLPVITDVRSSDIARNGQGAPLAPLADKLLFSEFKLFLNLGGIANLSWTSPGHELAYDICACNQLFNFYAKKHNLDYDDGGRLASSGTIQPEIPVFLNQWSYYNQPYPKSLDNTEVVELIKKLDQTFDYSTEDFMRSSVEHVSEKIAEAFLQLDVEEFQEIFVSGGGAYNSFLIAEIQSKLDHRFNLHIPFREIIDFKEAILLALTGLCRWLGLPTFDHRLSGASTDTSGGAIHSGSLTDRNEN